MTIVNPQLSLGLKGLDRVLRGLIPGDNIVFEVDSIQDYAPFTRPYAKTALERGHKVTYFRFSAHPPLLDPSPLVNVRELHPDAGFETFIAEVHQTIEENGRGGYYVFDCLSELAVDWYSDQMLASFFMLTCPYLYDVEAIAYFAVLRNYHSGQATAQIVDTTQIYISVRRHEGSIYVHPLKVQQRYSPTMHTLHRWEGDDFVPVRESVCTAEVLTATTWLHPEAEHYRVGLWHRAFLKGEQFMDGVRRGVASPDEQGQRLRRLVRTAVSRNDRVRELVENHLDLPEVLQVGKRCIGTGLVGGKSVGMLTARAILRGRSPRWAKLLEAHDSFYIASDVFYTYLVQNGIWWMRQRQKDPEHYLDRAERPRQRMLTGQFPAHIISQFEGMLDYFGQSPIIVRSSSLLEDDFGNSFAGKYESVFCANQGPREQRLHDFLSAVRAIYASSMSEKALSYRAARGLLDHDEQMALLVQRVSGSSHDSVFYPHLAGVALSYNPYVWHEQIDPASGMMRLVFGLGTRAVDKVDDDYTRVVALNAPELRPETSFDRVRQYSQRRVDVLDLTANQLVTTDLASVLSRSQGVPVELFTSSEERLSLPGQDQLTDASSYVLTFERLFRETSFVSDMREMLAVLEDSYRYPVDVEFTANFREDRSYRINIVQCRPLQVQGVRPEEDPPAGIDPGDVVLEAEGSVIGNSRAVRIDRLLYVEPNVYSEMPLASRYSLAKLIGRIAHLDRGTPRRNLMLLGPGRWGTTTPSLGVPVRFIDIGTASVLCEIAAMRGDFVPDVSLGTHFLNELIEADMLYLALYPARDKNFLNRELLLSCPNRLVSLVPEAAQWADALRVVDGADLGEKSMMVYANSRKRRVVCCLVRR